MSVHAKMLSRRSSAIGVNHIQSRDIVLGRETDKKGRTQEPQREQSTPKASYGALLWIPVNMQTHCKGVELYAPPNYSLGRPPLFGYKNLLFATGATRLRFDRCSDATFGWNSASTGHWQPSPPTHGPISRYRPDYAPNPEYKRFY